MSAQAWGPEGHQAVAMIAQDNLTPAVKKKIKALLGPHNNLASISTWADDIEPARPETAPWHYIDLPYRKPITVSDEEDYCPGGNCIVNQISLEEAALRNPSLGKEQKLEALKFLVHFMGDLHQPLHCADDGDHGGNEKLMLFLPPWPDAQGKRVLMKINLHALWDNLIAPGKNEDPRDLAKSLERSIFLARKKDKWAQGNEKDWALESYMLAKTHIYPGLDYGPQDYTYRPLPANYFYEMRPLVCLQLEKAGIRLAHVLNGIFQ